MSVELAAPGLEGTDVFELMALDENWKEYEQKTTPQHTAERLKKHEPAKYETLRRALEEGAPISQLARTHIVGNHTLYAIIKKEFGSLQHYKSMLAEKATMVGNLCMERVAELLPDCESVKDAAIAAGVMFDKAAQLSNAPQLVVEHHVTIHQEGIDKINAAFSEIQERLVTGRVVGESGAGLCTETLTVETAPAVPVPGSAEPCAGDANKKGGKPC